jgi:hypothetical protein
MAPGLFTANGDGAGVVAATAVRAIADSNLQSPRSIPLRRGTRNLLHRVHYCDSPRTQ